MYTVIFSPSPGLALIESPRYGTVLWAKASRPNRKYQRCEICRRKFSPGTALLYRPTGNPQNRMERICSECIGGVT